MPRNSSMIEHKKTNNWWNIYNCGCYWYDVFSLHCSSSHQCVTYCSLQCPYYVSALQVILMFSNAVVTMYSWSLALPLWHFTKRLKAKLSILGINKPSSSWEFSTFVSVLSFIFSIWEIVWTVIIMQRLKAFWLSFAHCFMKIQLDAIICHEYLWQGFWCSTYIERVITSASSLLDIQIKISRSSLNIQAASKLHIYFSLP